MAFNCDKTGLIQNYRSKCREKQGLKKPDCWVPLKPLLMEVEQGFLSCIYPHMVNSKVLQTQPSFRGTKELSRIPQPLWPGSMKDSYHHAIQSPMDLQNTSQFFFLNKSLHCPMPHLVLTPNPWGHASPLPPTPSIKHSTFTLKTFYHLSTWRKKFFQEEKWLLYPKRRFSPGDCLKKSNWQECHLRFNV